MFLLIIVSSYLIGAALACTCGLVFLLLDLLPKNAAFMKLTLMSCAVAGIAGCLYCLRAVYINKCVYRQWDSNWAAWYFLRPVTSIMAGGASYLFLKAGLLILDSKQETASSDIGFLALAFIAGFNVDKFLSKIESVAQAVWGIEKSRAASASKEE